MERNFKKEIQEAASNPIDMAEMMAQLVQVLKGSTDRRIVRQDTTHTKRFSSKRHCHFFIN